MTTFGGHSVPFSIGEGGGFGPDFTTSPIRLIGQTLVYAGANAPDAGFRFGPNADGNLMRHIQPPQVLVAVPNQPQWHENTTAGPFPGGPWNHRLLVLDPDGTDTATPFFDFPVAGLWMAMQGKAYQWLRPAAATTVVGTCIVQIADAGDLTTILAQATMRFEYQRP